MLLLSPVGTSCEPSSRGGPSAEKHTRKCMSLKQKLVVIKGYEESQSRAIVCLVVVSAEATAKYEG